MSTPKTTIAPPYEPYLSCFIRKNIFIHGPNHGTLSSDILDLTDDQIKEVELSWSFTKEKNAEIWKQRTLAKQSLIQETEALFAKTGMPTYRTSPHGKITGTYPQFKAVIKAIDAQCSYGGTLPYCYKIKVGDKEYGCNHSPCSLLELVTSVRRQVQAIKTEEVNRSKEFALAASLAAKYNIAIDDSDLLRKVTEADKEAWIKENAPEGTEFTVSGCEDCSTWCVGDSRCNCGNRRIYLSVQGSIGNWSAYGEAY